MCFLVLGLSNVLFLQQAYSPIPPHGFLASSPQAHPYMWGVQVLGRFLFIFKVYESVIIDTNAHDSINWLHLVVMVLKIDFFFPQERRQLVERLK